MVLVYRLNMKRNIYYLRIGFLIVILSSCAQSSRENQTAQTTGRINESNLSVSHNEDFYGFLEKFNTEEFFQMKRIVFPIKVVVPDAEDEGMAPMEETIGKYDWELLDLTYDSTYASRDYDSYLQNIVFKKDSAIVEIRGIDNGIYADYYFKLLDDKWFLVSLTESSF